jgi:hypothetical protein
MATRSHLEIALGAGYAATQALWVAATPLFPPGGGAVARLADGSSYVDYPNGLRYTMSPTTGKAIVTTRAIKFYRGTSDGYSDGDFYATEADCRAYDERCLVQPAAIFKFTQDEQFGVVDATVLSRADDLNPYFINPDSGTPGLDMTALNWLTAPHPPDITAKISGMGLEVLSLVLPISGMGGLLLWLAFPTDITRAISPGSTLRTDRSAVIFRGLALTLLSLAAVIILVRIPYVFGFITLTVGTVSVVIWSIAMGLLAITLSTWLRFQVARVWLASSGRLPWRLMAFLEEAHSRGALRQVGAAYQFRHALLQERLATRAKTPRSVSYRPAQSRHMKD